MSAARVVEQKPREEWRGLLRVPHRGGDVAIKEAKRKWIVARREVEMLMGEMDKVLWMTEKELPNLRNKGRKKGQRLARVGVRRASLLRVEVGIDDVVLKTDGDGWAV